MKRDREPGPAAPAGPPRRAGRLGGGLLAGMLGGTAATAAAPPPPSAAATSTLALLGVGASATEAEADAAYVAATAAAQRRSVLRASLFGASAPQVDELDRPFFQFVNGPLLPQDKMAALLGKLHHPAPTLDGSLLLAEVEGAVAAPPPVRLHKTPDEIRKERLARRRAEAKEGKGAGSGPVEQRVTMKHAEAASAAADSLADALRAEGDIRAQVEARLVAHEQANHERHMAALPHKIAHREDTLRRKAETNPTLAVYRIFPIREAASLGMFVAFANDQRLRGFVAWIDKRDAVVVLQGGDAPMRHLHNWITERMEWRQTAETRAGLAAATRVGRMELVSFHERAAAAATTTTTATAGQPSAGEAAAAGHVAIEPVYLKEFGTAAAARRYFSEAMPATGPWPSLDFLWNAAMELRLEG